MAKQAVKSCDLARDDHLRFDVLRGLMAIIVLISHVSQILLWRVTGLTSAAMAGHIAGRQAVIVFFLLSGYLITHSIQRNIGRHEHFAVRDYVIARLARIYPPLIGALLLAAAAAAAIHFLALPGGTKPFGLQGDLYRVQAHFSVASHDILDALLMRQRPESEGPLWTLAMEFHLYMAALIFAAPRVTGFFSRIGCCLAGAAGLFLLRDAVPLALVWLIGAGFALWPVGRARGFAIAALAAVATLTVAVLDPALFGSRMDSIAGLAAMQAPALMLAALIFAAPPRWRYPGWLVGTGAYSYSLYVIHWPLLFLVLALSETWTGHSMIRALVVALISTPIILFLASAFAAALEQPGYFARLLRDLLGPDAAPSRQDRAAASQSG